MVNSCCLDESTSLCILEEKVPLPRYTPTHTAVDPNIFMMDSHIRSSSPAAVGPCDHFNSALRPDLLLSSSLTTAPPNPLDHHHPSVAGLRRPDLLSSLTSPAHPHLSLSHSLSLSWRHPPSRHRTKAICVQPENNNNTIKTVDKFSALNLKSKFMLVLCVVTYFLTGLAFCLLAPFFPKEAAAKGMSLTLTGFVFSVLEFVLFAACPFFGKYLTSIGPKFALISGTLVGGVSNVLFGTLNQVPAGTPFIVLSFACRSLEALGFASFITAAMTLVASQFPTYVTTAIAILETSYGVGMMVGPALGGALYDLGGFGVPFYLTGALVVLIGVLLLFAFPTSTVVESSKTVSICSLLQSPMVVIPMLSAGTCAMGITFMEPTLAAHLDGFGLSVTVVGLVFVICPTMYAIFSITFGYLTDKKGFQNTLLVVGHFISGIGMFFLGPSNLFPFLPLELWTIITGLVLVGFGYGCLIIPSLQCMLKGAKELGFEQDIETYAVVSGLLNSVYFFGAFLGPLAGGFLIQQLSYSMGYSLVGVVHLFQAVLVFFFFLIRLSCSKREDYESL